MPSCARREIFDPTVMGIYHCYSRCVRGQFLCGVDRQTGKDYSHRKDWIEDRSEELAAIFAIEVLDEAVLDNHLHHVIRNRPDLLAQWSDEEVARRWLWLFPKRRKADGKPATPRRKEIQKLMEEPRFPELRPRLGSISWFMKALKELIAKRGNAEDKVKGHFFQERFKSVRLLDESAVLACSVYVDLNVIRAGMAATPEESRHTSAWRRIRSLLEREGVSIEQLQGEPAEAPVGDARAAERAEDDPVERAAGDADTARAEPSPGTPVADGKSAAASQPAPDAWLAPIDERGDERNRTAPVHRASDYGFLPMTVEQYLRLLDWTGREVRGDKRGVIPADLVPILERLGLDSERLVETLGEMDGRFPRALGKAQKVAEAAAQAGKKWFKGIDFCRRAFG
jgi:hypothetical protein